MYRKILVPLDGSKEAEAAIPYAEEIAAVSSAEVIIAGVSENPAAQPLHQQYMEGILASVLGDLKKAGYKGVGGHSTTVTGKAAPGILEVAANERIDLVTISRRGHTGPGPWPLGSVASRVLQKSTIPVLLVKGGGRAAGQTRLMKRILVPLDTSPAGAAAVPYALELASLLDASVVLFHVEPQPQPWLLGPGVEYAYLPATSSEQQAKKLLSHMEYLEEIARTFEKRGIPVSRQAASGSPAGEILAFASTNDIDLIALSTHGQSGIAEFVYGSVTEKVLHAGSTPVLVVRPSQEPAKD